MQIGAKPRTRRIARNARGFTLMEIMLAVLILAVAVVPMMNAFNLICWGELL